MKKKGLLVISLLFILPILSLLIIPAVHSNGCCVSASYGCTPTSSQACASQSGTYYDNKYCNEIPQEKQDDCIKGCCCTNYPKINFDKIQCGNQKFNSSIDNTNDCNAFCNYVPTCQQVTCGAGNIEGCACGNEVTTADNLFCNLDKKQVFATAEECSAVESFINVTGKVFHDNNIAIPSANISWLEGSVLSDSQGNYKIQVPVNKNTALTARKINYSDKTLSANAQTTNIVLNFNLSKTIGECQNGQTEKCTTLLGVCKDSYRTCINHIWSNCNYTSLSNWESAESTCNDNKDNDCDGYIDNEDSQCTGTQQCGDGKVTGTEDCDGSNDKNCPGKCVNCVCQSECGNDIRQGTEQCDATYLNFVYVSGDKGSCNDNQYCNNCECKPIPPTCGDGKVVSPEECEKNSDCSNYNNPECILPGQPNACQCAFPSICGNGVREGFEECDGGDNCYPPNHPKECKFKDTCSDSPENFDFQLDDITAVKAQPFVNLNWDSECTPSYYFVQKCEGSNCNDFKTITDPIQPSIKTFKDTITPESNFCYRIVATFTPEAGSASSKYSNVQCIETGDKECLKPTTEFCIDTSRSKCDDENKVTTIEDCSSKNAHNEEFICMGPYDDSTTKCTHLTNCDECGNPFAIFLYDAVATVFNGKEYYPSKCQNILSCYEEQTKTAVNDFETCNDVKSCYDYHYKNSCESDHCEINNCTWMQSNYQEVGVGVCVPQDEKLQDCSLCNDPYNVVFGACDKEMCSLFGSCYLDGDECKGKNEIGCRNYDDVYDCTNSNSIHSQENYIGPKNRIVNTSYTNSVRLNGNNQLTQKSDDYFGFGTCYWGATLGSEGTCMKDADNNKYFDCGLYDLTCQNDNQPPETKLIINNIYPKKLNIPYSVLDNTYNQSESIGIDPQIETFFSVVPLGQPYIYPNQLATNSIISTDSITSSGRYTLYYYSKDYANNLEPVKSLNITVDATPPIVTIDLKKRGYETPPESDNWYSDLNFTLNARDLNNKVICTANFSAKKEPYLDKQLGNVYNLNYIQVPDGYYTFYYSCADSSGNVVSKRIPIKVEADMSIYDPQPNSTISYNGEIQISVKTQKPSVCKYHPTSTDYDNMILFSTTSAKTHVAKINSDQKNKSFKYEVRCKQNDGKLIGNNGDRIIFTIDKIPPVSNFYVGDEKLNMTLWRHQPLNVKLQSIDPEINDFLDTPSEFGNVNLYFCQGIGCTPEAINSDQTSLTITQPTWINYFGIDAGGNKEDKKTTLIKVDTIEPTFNITIKDLDLQLTDVVTGKTFVTDTFYQLNIYQVDLYASEDLSKIDQFDYTVAGTNYPLLGVRKISGDHWKGFLILDDALQNIQTNSTFIVQAEDMSGLAGSIINSGATFKIDSKGPDTPILNPLLGEISNKFGDTYYTNKKLKLTGYTLDHPILVHLNNDDEDLQFIQSINPPLFSKELLNNAVAGSNQLTIQDTNISKYMGKYFKVTKRAHYLPYPNTRNYYNITSVIKSGNNVILNISPSLIAPAIEITIYDKPYPDDYFEFNPDYNKLNKFNLYGIDSLGNIGPKSETYDVYYETKKPTLLHIHPKPNTTVTINRGLNYIVGDEVGINSQTIKLSRNNNLLNPLKIKKSDSLYDKYEIKKFPTISLSNGIYNVSFYTEDYASNSINLSYQYEVCSDCPVEPNFLVTNGHKYGDFWFVNTNYADYRLSFSNEVNLTQISTIPTTLLTHQTENNVFFNGKINFTNQGYYKLNVKAKKPISEKEGRWYYDLIYDSEKPEFNVTSPNITISNTTYVLKINLTNEDYPVNSLIQTPYGNYTLKNNEAKFNIPLNATSFPIQISLTDLAGNQQNKTFNLIVDNTFPDVTLKEILEADRLIYKYKNGTRIAYIKDENKIIRLKGNTTPIKKLGYYNRIKNDGSFRLINQTFNELYKLEGFPDFEAPNDINFVATDFNGRVKEKVYYIVLDNKAPDEPLIYLEKSTGLENNPGIDVTDLPLPFIRVEYSEPVTINDYSLTQGENDQELDFVQIDNSTYTFKPKQDLSNLQYVFNITSSDDLSNRRTDEKTFLVNSGSTKIFIEQPRFGVSQSETFNSKFRTTRISQCKYSFTANQNIIYNAMELFTNTNAEYHDKTFTLGLGQSYPFVVKCNDSEEIVSDQFVFSIDKVDPIIESMNFDPSTITEKPTETLLTVNVNEDALCKYSISNIPYINMNYFDDNNPKVRSTFVQTQKTYLDFTDTSRRVIKYYVQCEDVSGRLSKKKTIDLTIDFESPNILTFHTPERYTSKTNLFLNMSTTKKSSCKYKNSTELIYTRETSSLVEPSKTHTASMGEFSEGTHTLMFRCFEPNGIQTNQNYTFTVDTTKPSKPNIELSNVTCQKKNKLWDLSFKAKSIDNESGIKGYNYTIYDGFGKQIKNWTYSSSENIVVSNLNFSKSNYTSYNYEVRVRAINNANLLGDISISSKTRAYESTENVCIETNPPQTGLDVKGTKDGINVTILCRDESGCDYNSIFYNTASSPSSCNPLKPYNNSFLTKSNQYVCWTVSDTVGNKVNKTELINISTCFDIAKNGAETDIDCGGVVCDKCDTGKECLVNSDCKSNICYKSGNKSICAPEPSCTNLFLDQDETDIDCGGLTCSKCLVGKICKVDNDCESGWCRDLGQGLKCQDKDDIDTDGDGIADWWEIKFFGCPTCANPDEDTDGDGLTNLKEYQYYRKTGRLIDPTKKDTDGDGWSDSKEIEKGTNPVLASEFPRSIWLQLLLLILGIILLLSGSSYLIYKEVNKPKPVLTPKPMPQPKSQFSPDYYARLRQQQADLARERARRAREKRLADRMKLFSAFGPKKPKIVNPSKSSKSLPIKDIKPNKPNIFDRLLKPKQNFNNIFKELSLLFGKPVSNAYLRLLTKDNINMLNQHELSESQLYSMFVELKNKNKLHKNLFKLILIYMNIKKKIPKGKLISLIDKLHKNGIIDDEMKKEAKNEI